MANESREAQRFERLKQNANKYMALIENNPNDEMVSRWNERLQDMLRGIQVLVHEIAAAELKAEQSKPGGVHIEVPVGKFILKSDTPSVAD